MSFLHTHSLSQYSLSETAEKLRLAFVKPISNDSVHVGRLRSLDGDGSDTGVRA